MSGLLTADDIWRMGIDDEWYELIDGVPHERHGVGALAGVTGIDLATFIVMHVRRTRQGLGFGPKTGFILARNPDTLLFPSFAMVRNGRIRGRELPDGFCPWPPDLAVEVDSPATGRLPARNIPRYLAAGTRLVWHIDPGNATFAIHTPDEPVQMLRKADSLDGGDVLPGFLLPLAKLFRWGIGPDPVPE